MKAKVTIVSYLAALSSSGKGRGPGGDHTRGRRNARAGTLPGGNPARRSTAASHLRHRHDECGPPRRSEI